MQGVRLYVDTVVWWKWLAHRTGQQSKAFTDSELADVVATQTLFEAGRADPKRVQLLYSALNVLELRRTLRTPFREVVVPHAQQVPIPLTRTDGLYFSDGSVLCGGTFGGSLRSLLDLSGGDHEQLLHKVALGLGPGELLYEQGVRRKEFDIEHLEASLEAQATLFVTSDRSTIVRPFRGARRRFSDGSPEACAIDMIVTPPEAVGRLSI